MNQSIHSKLLIAVVSFFCMCIPMSVQAGWNINNLSIATGATNRGDPRSDACSDVSGYVLDNTQHVVYTRCDGHIVELKYINGGWHYNDLTVASGAPPRTMNGAYANAPSGYTWGKTQHVVYNADGASGQQGGHIHELWFDGTWHFNDLTIASGAPANALFAPSGYATHHLAVRGQLALGDTQHVVYLGDDKHIHELWFDGIWHFNDLTIASGAPANANSTPSGYASGNTQYVVYQSANRHIHELWFDGTWHFNDLTNASGAPATASYRPAGYTWGNTRHVVYTSSDFHVHELWLNGGGWHFNDLTYSTGAPAVAWFNPSGYAWGNTMHVIYPDYNGNINELWFDGNWYFSDLTKSIRAPMSNVSGVSGYTWSVDNTEHVVYTSNEGIIELWRGGM